MFTTLDQEGYAKIYGDTQAKNIFEIYCWSVCFFPIEPITSVNVVHVNAWCVEQFGPAARTYKHGSRWINPFSGNYFFRSMDDAMMFKIRWC